MKTSCSTSPVASTTDTRAITSLAAASITEKEATQEVDIEAEEAASEVVEEATKAEEDTMARTSTETTQNIRRTKSQESQTQLEENSLTTVICSAENELNRINES